MASSSLKSTPLYIAFLLLAWFVSSSVAVLLTKALFSGFFDVLAPFAFGLTVTATNNVVAWFLSRTGREVSNDLYTDRNIRRFAWIISMTTAAEIGLSNIALNLLSVSYSTVLKGMAPLFVMTWGAVFGLHRLQPGLVASMMAIFAGVMLAVIGESGVTKSVNRFSFTANAGFLAQLVSALLAGFRWTLTQIFVQGEHVPHNYLSFLNVNPLSRALTAMETIRVTAPLTLFSLLPVITLVESPSLMSWFNGSPLTQISVLTVFLCVIGTCVFGLLWAEYELVKVTSSLTVSVAFVVKELLLIFAGSLIFKDRLSLLTAFGFVVVQIGIFGYATVRRRVKQLKERSSDGLDYVA